MLRWHIASLRLRWCRAKPNLRLRWRHWRRHCASNSNPFMTPFRASPRTSIWGTSTARTRAARSNGSCRPRARTSESDQCRLALIAPLLARGLRHCWFPLRGSPRQRRRLLQVRLALLCLLTLLCLLALLRLLPLLRRLALQIGLALGALTLRVLLIWLTRLSRPRLLAGLT